MSVTDFEIRPAEMRSLQNKLSKLSMATKSNVYVDAMKDVTVSIERELKRNVSGEILKVRSGTLRNSIQSRVMIDSGGIIGVVGSGARTGKRTKYANILETGGTITAKNGKYLTIPTQFAKTRSGVVRKGAREYEDTFVRKTKSGKMIIFQSNGKDKITPLFILKRSVKIPAKKYLSKTLNAMKKTIASKIKYHIDKGLKNG